MLIQVVGIQLNEKCLALELLVREYQLEYYMISFIKVARIYFKFNQDFTCAPWSKIIYDPHKLSTTGIRTET